MIRFLCWKETVRQCFKVLNNLGLRNLWRLLTFTMATAVVTTAATITAAFTDPAVVEAPAAPVNSSAANMTNPYAFPAHNSTMTITSTLPLMTTYSTIGSAVATCAIIKAEAQSQMAAAVLPAAMAKVSVALLVHAWNVPPKRMTMLMTTTLVIKQVTMHRQSLWESLLPSPSHVSVSVF